MEVMKEMDMYSKRQYLKTLQENYLKGSKTEKTAILDEYIKNTGHNRKYVIFQLNNLRLAAGDVENAAVDHVHDDNC